MTVGGCIGRLNCLRGKTWKTKNGELYQSSIGQLSVIVSGSKPFSEACWAEYCQICLDALKEEVEPLVVLNYAPIMGPNAAQRRRFNNEVSVHLQIERVALISDMALVRGALIAMSWFTQGKPTIRPFSPAEIDQGFLWLRELYEFSLDEARALLLELVREQGDDPIGLLNRTDFPRRAQRM